jgi:peptide/nickel transport system substrate-binding protein
VGAGDGTRTRDSLLGRQELYQLSYSRQEHPKYTDKPTTIDDAPGTIPTAGVNSVMQPGSRVVRLVRVPTFLGVLLMLAAACAGPGAGGQRSPSQGEARSTPTILRLAVHEPVEVLYGESANVQRELGDIFNGSLAFLDHSGQVHPKLAEKIPSIADGDWRTSPDGTMEVTWKLKPNLKWHDGTPITAEDVAFGVRMFSDPGSRFSVPLAIRFIDEAVAVDPQTVTMRYRRVYNGAAVNITPDFPMVPRHVLQETYTQVGAEGLSGSPVWTTEWVGVGPFRLMNHVLGNQIEGAAFDDYVFGRPRIDRVIVRIIPDVNTIVANLLANELDGVLTGALEAAHAADLRRRWEAPGQGTVGVVQNRVRQMQLQYRDTSLPWASDLRIRQAALHVVDRQAIVDGLIHGLTSVADVPALPSSPLYASLERRGFARYPYDRAQGERILDAAGWPRGADGIRRNAAATVFTWNPAVSGEPDLPEVLVIVDGYKAAGIASEPDLIPDSMSSNDRNERRGRSHSITRSSGLDSSYWERFISSEISTPENRWRGNNTGGYSSPALESLYGQWRVALDPGTRAERETDLAKMVADELIALPLFYNVDVFAYRKGLIGPKANNGEGRNVSLDAHTWRYE